MLTIYYYYCYYYYYHYYYLHQGGFIPADICLSFCLSCYKKKFCVDFIEIYWLLLLVLLVLVVVRYLSFQRVLVLLRQLCSSQASHCFSHLLRSRTSKASAEQHYNTSHMITRHHWRRLISH